jgi:hypothetical protein
MISYPMKTFRWSITLLLLGLVAALISAIVFLQLSGTLAYVLLLIALLLLILIATFGKQGV